MQIRLNAQTTALLTAVAVAGGTVALWRQSNVEAPLPTMVRAKAVVVAATPAALPAAAMAGLDPMQRRLLKNLSRQKQGSTIDVCYAPGTDPAYVARIEKRLHPVRSEGPAFFQLGQRWSSTATNGGGLTRGTPTTLTWSIVPDGTSIPADPSIPAEVTAPSSMIAFLNGIYTNQATWQPLIQQVFDRWSNNSGVTYVFEPNDDGAAFPNSAGLLNTRGDLRLSGHPIDGASKILAYNFFPDTGDLVMDTNDGAIYGNLTNGSRSMRNIIAHEHGHGLAFDHVCPIDQTKLMEPFLATTFDGPQLDEILGVQRLYGDRAERSPAGNNDTSANATSLGILPLTTTTLSALSIDGTDDTDVFRFGPSAANLAVTITLRPTGALYLEGPQNGDGSCSAGTPFDSRIVNDLNMQLIGPDGATVLVTANSAPPGQVELITNFTLPGVGPFFVRVTGGAVDNVQAYDLDFTFGTGGPTPTPGPTATPVPTATPLPTPTATPLPGGNGDIVFVSTRDGNRELYAMTPQGANVRRLTNNPAIDDQPHVSRAGHRIVFVSTRNGNNEIYTMNGDGTNVVRVTTNAFSDEQPQFSPDSARIVFVSNRSGNHEIYTMNVNGTGLTRLTFKAASDDHPCFNFNSSKIVFQSRRTGNDEIFVMNADGSNVVQLTHSAQIDARPNFSQDGSKIIFQSSVSATNYEIYVMNSDGSAQTRLTFSNAADCVPTFSRDGQFIAFSATRNGTDNELCVNNLSSEKTSPVTVLTTNTLDDWWPTWGLLPGSGNLETPQFSAIGQRSVASPEAASSLLADAKRSLLLINFTGALDAASVADGTYDVTINGETITVESAALLGGSTISLLLPEGSVHSGDSVTVTCHRLRDDAGGNLKPVPLGTVAH